MSASQSLDVWNSGGAKSQPTVMISSTHADLQDYRSTLRDALESAGFSPIVMESRGARPRKTSTEVMRWVQEADVYVAVLGMRYGSRDGESGRSFTHIEFQEAIRCGKPCLVYVMDDEHSIPTSRVDRGPDSDALIAFKREVATLVTPEKFTTPDNLARKVLSGLMWLSHEQRLLHLRGLTVPESPVRDAPVEGALELPIDRLSNEPYRITIQSLSDEQKTDIAAGLLAGALCRGDFTILENQASIAKPVWDRLTAFVAGAGISHDKLAIEILRATDVFHVRLLVMIAGALRAAGCVEAIVLRYTFDGQEIDEVLRAHRYGMRQFKDVVGEALSRMPIDAVPSLEMYRKRAQGRKWTVHRVLGNAIKAIKKNAS